MRLYRRLFQSSSSARKSSRQLKPVLTSLEDRTTPAIYTVTSNADSGTGTLREALGLANGSPGADTIKFAIGSGFASIALSSALPDVSDAVTIDGTSQPGYAGNPVVEINGAGAGSSAQGFKVTSGLVTLQGLIINRFAKQGIWLFGGGSNVIRNCWIGLNTTGSAAAANGDDGIFIDKSSGNTIGGLGTGDRNVISGNSAKGIHFLFNGQANNNKMIGNYIGTDITGKYAIGNGASGIDFFGPATYNTISNNVISGNAGHGITFFGGDASDNLIADNNIGVDVTGVQGIPNNGNGVDIWGPPRITVKNNVIAANKGSGVVINSENIIVQGNFIGTDRTRTKNLGNLDYGVVVGGLSSPKDTRIGGPNLADGNVIANNGSIWTRPGVYVSSGSTGVLIFNNSIYDNASIGIDLNGDNKVNPNDTGDPDTGGNNLLNFPVITTAVGGTGKVTIAGTYNGLANTNFTLQFFSSVAADTSGYGEGRDILGTTNITTDGSGNATFNVSFNSSLIVVGSKISATATTAGNGVGSGYTSEFCQTVSVTAAPTADLAITAQPVTNAVLGTNYSYSYRVTNNGPSSVTLVSVNVPLPVWLTYTSSSATSTSVDASNVVSMDVGTLAAGAFADLTLTVFPTGFGPTSTTASVVGLNTDNNQANNSITTNVLVKDKPGVFQFDSTTLFVGEYESVATINVNRVGGSGGPASVTYRVAAGGAESGTDFLSPTSGVLNFADGQALATFTITILNDALHEGDETLNLSLINPTAGTSLGSPATSIMKIYDDDSSPAFSVTDISQPEGTGAGQSAVFAISLSAPSGLPATVTYSTTDGTASAGSDYTAAAGILTFLPGETTKTVSVNINGDALLENEESFYLDLTAPTESTISKSRGFAALANDDVAPAISVADSSITETTGTTQQLVFTVVLSIPSGLTTKVNYATAAGTALSSADFTTASGQLVFLPGETSKQVKVFIAGDSLFENSENFSLILTQPVNATLERSTAVGTINDNDVMPVVSIDSQTVTEPDTGSTTNATFTIRLSTVSGLPTSVQVATLEGSAKDGNDFQAISQLVTIPAGSVSATVVVKIVGDRLFESTDTFTVQLSGPTNAMLGTATGSGSIKDNDVELFLSLNDVRVVEGDSGSAEAVFNVALTAACEADISVNYATVDGSATAGIDYQATAGTLVIPAGQTSGQIRVAVFGDTKIESYEKSFAINLVNPVNVTLAKTTASCTIVDNDSAGTFAFAQPTYTVNETEASGKVFITVNRTNGGLGSVTIPYSIAGINATAGVDFSASGGMISFAEGQASATIEVPVINDSLVEIVETFTVTLGSPSSMAASLGNPSSTIVSIISEDTTPPAPQITAVKTTVARGSMTAINITFSQDLDPNSIKNLASYTLVAAGRDKKFGTRDDTKYRITKVAYNVTTRTLTITNASIRLTVDLQLTISATGSTMLKDKLGQALDGDRNGTPGANAVVKISKTGLATF